MQRLLFDTGQGEQVPEKPVVLSYGLGVDSTAILLRWIRDRRSRNFPLESLIMLTAQTGDEFQQTGEHVERHILPLLREFRIRYVQVARAGPLEADDIVVLDATRAIKGAESAQAKEPRYGPLAAQIVQRANLILPITEEQARALPNYKAIEEKDAYNYGEPFSDPQGRDMARRRDVEGSAILECVKGLAGHEVMFEEVLKEAEWNAAFAKVMNV